MCWDKGMSPGKEGAREVTDRSLVGPALMRWPCAGGLIRQYIPPTKAHPLNKLISLVWGLALHITIHSAPFLFPRKTGKGVGKGGGFHRAESPT